ncbi:MAG: DNA-binding NtrC family response regulator [Planctomycetota bacterium]
MSIKEVREIAVQRAESAYLRAILKNANGHLGDAAKVVGLSARALYQKMKRYDLKKEYFKGS